MMSLLAAILLAAPVPAKAEPAPSPAPEVALVPENSPHLSRSVAPPLLVLTLMPEVGTRRVSYRDRVSTGLATYQSGAIGMIKAALEIYPATGKGLPVVSNIGFFGSTARSLRASVEFAPGASFDDQWHMWDVGARWRGIFSGQELVGLSIRYGSISSIISGPNLGSVLLPSGVLQYWRPGLDLRVPIGPLAFSVNGGYLAMVSSDAIGHAFPRSTSAGVDVGGALSYTVNSHIELHLAGHYTRFFYTLNPEPNDPFVAGGALDEYAVFDLGFSWRV